MADLEYTVEINVASNQDPDPDRVARAVKETLADLSRAPRQSRMPIGWLPQRRKLRAAPRAAVWTWLVLGDAVSRARFRAQRFIDWLLYV